MGVSIRKGAVADALLRWECSQAGRRMGPEVDAKISSP